jgi:hypothetical protein
MSGSSAPTGASWSRDERGTWRRALDRRPVRDRNVGEVAGPGSSAKQPGLPAPVLLPSPRCSRLPRRPRAARQGTTCGSHGKLRARYRNEAWLSHKSGLAAWCCLILQRRAMSPITSTFTCRVAVGFPSRPTAKLEVSTTPPTYATPSGTSDSARNPAPTTAIARRDGAGPPRPTAGRRPRGKRARARAGRWRALLSSKSRSLDVYCRLLGRREGCGSVADTRAHSRPMPKRERAGLRAPSAETARRVRGVVAGA